MSTITPPVLVSSTVLETCMQSEDSPRRKVQGHTALPINSPTDRETAGETAVPRSDVEQKGLRNHSTRVYSSHVQTRRAL